jgi:predicted nucleic-acid-binding protein
MKRVKTITGTGRFVRVRVRIETVFALDEEGYCRKEDAEQAIEQLASKVMRAIEKTAYVEIPASLQRAK